MFVTINGNKRVDLSPGDVIDSSIYDHPITIIGIRAGCFAYTYEDIRERHQLLDYPEYMEEYRIDPTYSKETWFQTGSTCDINGIHRPTREQEQKAAWGEDGYVARPGAAFEFI